MKDRARPIAHNKTVSLTPAQAMLLDDLYDVAQWIFSRHVAQRLIDYEFAEIVNHELRITPEGRKWHKQNMQ